jgi:hypothetical protein
MQGKVCSWETIAFKCKVNWHVLLKVMAEGLNQTLMLGCWVRLGLRNGLLHIHEKKC